MYNFYTLGRDKYGVDAFTLGGKGKFVSVEEAFSNFTVPMCWAGNYKVTLQDHCEKHNIKYFNLDSGYFGNIKAKIYKRISINNLQDMGPIINRPDDRLKKLNLVLENFKRGSSVVIVPPDSKKAYTLKINLPTWIEDVTNQIKKYTDRPIRVRERPVLRMDRTKFDTFTDYIADNTFCVVGFSSNALVESILKGIPVIPIGPSATKSFSNYKISDVHDIPDIENEKRYAWACHLSYRQFTNEEMLSGLAWELMN